MDGCYCDVNRVVRGVRGSLGWLACEYALAVVPKAHEPVETYVRSGLAPAPSTCLERVCWRGVTRD